MRRNFWSKLKSFFWPNPSAPVIVRLAPYIALVIFGLLLIAGSVTGWNYTNSVSFCGTTCHTMPPQYVTYLRSPHARVACVECHLGRDVITVQLPRKLQHTYTLYALLFKKYEYPIVAKQMRPANEACETCHFPQKFSDDSLREIKSHQNDDKNTPSSIFLVMKIGGGTARQGLGKGIHWHIENKVQYYSDDPEHQTIPFVRVTDNNGKVTDFVDAASGFQLDPQKEKQLHNVDCIDCHNRVTHIVPYPEQAIDTAMNSGLISSKLPFIRAKAVEILNKTYPVEQDGMTAINALQDYYRTTYPDVYANQQTDLTDALKEIKTIYQQTRFPDQKLDWTSHPDNTGHKNSPGCFRCHDGKHIATNSNEIIRLECNLCHALPVISDASQFVTDVQIVRGPEPPSHAGTSWIMLHNKAIDTTCARCHPPKDPKVDYTKLNGQKPPLDGSFCGNSACHATEWKYMGFNSPAVQVPLQTELDKLIAARPKETPTPAPTPTPAEGSGAGEQPTPTPGAETGGARVTYTDTMQAIFNNRCSSCHEGASAMANMDLSGYQSVLTGNTTGPGITPGNLEKSLIYQIQSAGGHYGQMTPDEVALLKSWIMAGAPEK